MRRFNLIVVRLVTHQANTFPSGHAAAAVAVALELISAVPAAGFIYLVIAISIMVSAFVGRYHYALDVALGAALSCISFLLA
jgi:membrane-associated phospholipid phosphatase